jgi:hypothetical protein
MLRDHGQSNACRYHKRRNIASLFIIRQKLNIQDIILLHVRSLYNHSTFLGIYTHFSVKLKRTLHYPINQTPVLYRMTSPVTIESHGPQAGYIHAKQTKTRNKRKPPASKESHLPRCGGRRGRCPPAGRGPGSGRFRGAPWPRSSS